jgi:predicted acylesterase/phospholipase RssA
MPDGGERGDHDYVDAHDPEQCRAGYLPKPVCEAESVAIRKRREYITNKGIKDRTACPLTGLAFSGGGIRSASFGLGALQALHVSSGIEGIDYLSTVSGGGYIGCSLTATMQKSSVRQNTSGNEKTAETQKTNGKFPFTKPENCDDTDSVRHIRDFSNYLIPHSALDVITTLGIIGRGLIANVLIILPILLFFVWFTLMIHPTVESLSKPKFPKWDLTDGLVFFGLPVSDPRASTAVGSP